MSHAQSQFRLRFVALCCGGLLMAACLALPAPSWAASTAYELDSFPGDLSDKPSLQRGAQAFVNFCFGCHSLQYQRYQRTAEDLGIPEALFAAHLITTDAKIGEHIKSPMNPEAAKYWFGIAPPDLTMVTRVRSVDWVYSYLKSFYTDLSRPFGVNNKVFPNVGMPHALLELQGVPELGCRQMPRTADNGGEMRDPLIPGKVITEAKCNFINVQADTGSMNAEEYDLVVTDIVNFLDYVGEPARQDRERIGIFVLLYLAILFILAYMLNREYWRDIH